MTYNNSTPNWLVPCLLTFFIAIATLIFAYGAQSRQVSINTELLKNKVNYKPEFEMIMNQIEVNQRITNSALIRIEGQLEDHIKDTNNK